MVFLTICHELVKFGITELYFNVIYVIHANEQTEQASCGLHVNVWNFL